MSAVDKRPSEPPADHSWVTTCCVCCGRPEHVGVLRRLVERLRGKGT